MENAALQFKFDAEPVSCEKYGCGHINRKIGRASCRERV